MGWTVGVFRGQFFSGPVGQGVVVGEEERADAAGALGGVGPAGDDELLLMEALGLEPGGGAAGVVGGVGAFADDAFGMELAGVVEDGGGGAGEVLGEADGA
jgi:hypothetical protein